MNVAINVHTAAKKAAIFNKKNICKKIGQCLG